MKTHLTRSLMILLAVALAAPLVLAQEVKVVGVWDAVAETPEGNMPGVLTITEKDGALEASIVLGGIERSVTDVKLSDHTLEMTVMYDGAPYDVELEVDGDTMEGTYTGSAATGTMKATRQS